MSALILIVDDEKDLVDTLEFNLQREGYRTVTAYTGRAALDLAWNDPVPDLVLLDLMLPDLSGKEVCQRLRMDPRTRNVPIIMLTARDEEIDRVVGFEVGADDYVTKPYSIRELLLRLRAMLRRALPAHAAQRSASETVFGDLRVNLEGHRVWVEDEEVGLTALEFRLLATFISRKGRVQSRETLLHDVWGMQAGVTTRTVDTHIQRLRKKLATAGDYIETLRGVGYRFRSRPSAHEA